MADSSQFDGERKNALAAAQRIAEKYQLSFTEVARSEPKAEVADESHPTWHSYNLHGFVYNAHQFSNCVYNETVAKARWQAAVKEAKNRGLDWHPKKESLRKVQPHSIRKTSRHPIKHAQVLIHETSLPFREIAEITGLNLYQVVSIKLKLRKAA